MQLASDRSDAPSAPLRSYVAAWFIAGVVTVMLAVRWGAVDPERDLPVLLALALLVAVGEAFSFTLRAGTSGVTLSLVETSAVISLLLLPSGGAVIAVAAGVGSLHLLRRLPLRKLLFNVGMHTVAVGAASVVMAVFSLSPGFSLSRVFAAGLAILAYRGVDTVALLGIVRFVGAPELREHLLERPLHLVATTLGNASLGVIAAALWSSYPGIAWVVAGPAIALYLAYGAGYRIEELLAGVRAERDRLDRVVSGVGEGIVLHDADHRVGVWNAAIEGMTGILLERAVSADVRDLLRGRDDQGNEVVPVPTSTETGGDVTVIMMTVQDASGHDVPLRLSHTTLRDDGHAVGGVIVIHDLRREREAAALKQDFVARVSHELRTPLTPIRGYAQALLQAGDRVPLQKRNEVLTHVVERVGHLERMVDDLLLVSQIGVERVDPAREVQPTDVDLERLLPRLTDWLGDQVGDHRIEVVTTDDAPYVAWADPLRVGQIVTNLLTNACKYSSPASPVTIRLDRTADEVVLAVEDRGPGIPADKLDAIFQRFERLDDPQTQRAGGLGLGLYISRHLAEAMGGRLTATSTPHVGSVFVLHLRRSEDCGPHPDWGTAPLQGGGAAAPRVL